MRRSLCSPFALAALLVPCALSSLSWGQNLRDAGDPVGWWYFASQNQTNIENFIANNSAWATSVNRSASDPSRFQCSYVHNAGSYSSANSWFVADRTLAQLQLTLSLNNGEASDIDSWTSSSGVTLYAMTYRSAVNGLTHLYSTSDPSTILTEARAVSMRPYLITTNEINGVTQYTVAMRNDVGASWWVWGNVTQAFLRGQEAQGRRISDIEGKTNGRFNVCMRLADPNYDVRWATDLTTAEMQRWVQTQYGRVFDFQEIEPNRWLAAVAIPDFDVKTRGSGCNATSGPMSLEQNGSNRLGQTLRPGASNLPGPVGAPVFGLIGDDALHFSGILLPLDLGFLGAPGCPLELYPFLTITEFTTQTRKVEAVLPLPAEPLLAGYRFHLQWVVPNAGANTLGLVTTPMMTIKLKL